NARDRLAREPAPGECVEAAGFVRRERAIGRADHAGEVEAERVADQQTRVELGGIDAGGLKTYRKRTPCHFDGAHPVTPQRPAPPIARPGARSSARPPVRRALRPRSPAAACR